MPCRVSGCPNTWTWFAAQQVRALGQPTPERMCDEHLAQLNELGDVEVPCRNPGCPNTWLWRRGAQLAALQKTGKLRRPARLCEECFAAEQETQDAEIRCKVDTCHRHWVWPRDAQLRHRLWVMRQKAKYAAELERAREAAAERARAAEEAAAQGEAAQVVMAQVEAAQAEVAQGEAAQVEMAQAEAAQAEAAQGEAAEASQGEAIEASEGEASEGEASEGEASEGEAGAGEGGEAAKRKRRRRRRRGKGAAPAPEVALPPPPVIEEGPPARMCGLCSQKVSRLQTREVPCKVHGCTRAWSWDRASQLRAWAALGTDDLDMDPGAPRRMCEICRDFCRKHPDRAVPCGRPGCTHTWMYKTGAQLQAFLAGRTVDPLRLCDECARGGFINTLSPSELPEGAELMPCVVPGCSGTWVFFEGQRLSGGEVDADGLPLDRMCLEHRRERGGGGEAEAEAEGGVAAEEEAAAHEHDLLREGELAGGDEAAEAVARAAEAEAAVHDEAAAEEADEEG